MASSFASRFALAIATTASVSAFMYFYSSSRRHTPLDNNNDQTSEKPTAEDKVTEHQQHQTSPSETTIQSRKCIDTTLPALLPIEEESNDDDSKTSSCVSSPTKEDLVTRREGRETSNDGTLLLSPDLLLKYEEKRLLLLVEEQTKPVKSAADKVRVRKVKRSYDSDAVMMITQEDLIMMNELMQLESDDEKDMFDSFYRYDRKHSSALFS